MKSKNCIFSHRDRVCVKNNKNYKFSFVRGHQNVLKTRLFDGALYTTPTIPWYTEIRDGLKYYLGDPNHFLDLAHP
jgi:hypothetical protein